MRATRRLRELLAGDSTGGGLDGPLRDLSHLLRLGGWAGGKAAARSGPDSGAWCCTSARASIPGSRSDVRAYGG
jgi:hypothetical protein